MKTNILFLLPIILAIYPLKGSRLPSVFSYNNGNTIRLDDEKLPNALTSSLERFFDANSLDFTKNERDAIGAFLVSTTMNKFKEGKLTEYDLREGVLRLWNMLLRVKDIGGIDPALATDGIMPELLEALEAEGNDMRDSEQKAAIRSSLPEGSSSDTERTLLVDPFSSDDDTENLD